MIILPFPILSGWDPWTCGWSAWNLSLLLEFMWLVSPGAVELNQQGGSCTGSEGQILPYPISSCVTWVCASVSSPVSGDGHGTFHRTVAKTECANACRPH